MQLKEANRVLRTSVLVANANGAITEQIKASLLAQGYEVEVVTGGVDCVQRLQERAPHVLLLHSRLPWGGADGVLATLRDRQAHVTVPVVMLTDSDENVGLDSLSGHPVVRKLPPACSAEELVGGVRHAALVDMVRWTIN